MVGNKITSPAALSSFIVSASPFQMSQIISIPRQAVCAFLVLLCFSKSSAAPLADIAPFDTNRVMTLEFKVSEADWNELRYQHREAEFFPEEGKAAPADPYTWFPAEATIDGRAVGRVEVRKKGYIGSNDIRRPALKLRNADKSGEGSLELTLNNNRQDPALIRQFLAYEVFRRAGVPAPRCSFASLKVNGRDLGIYSCVQPINAKFLTEHFGNSDGNLYEGGRSDFRSNWVQNFVVKGKAKERADLERATAAIEHSKDSIMPALNAHFDSDEFFRFWAVESLINESDGYAANMNNFYLYNNPSGEKFIFIPWGADSTFYPGRPMNSVRGDPRSVIGTGILANRLYNSRDGASKYRDTLRSILEKAWNEDALLREVNRLEALLAPLAGSQAADFRGNIEYVRSFIRARRAEITPELDGPVPPLKSRPLEFAKRRNVGHFSGRFQADLSNGNASRESAGSVSLSGTLWDEKLVFRDVIVRTQLPDARSEERILIMFQGAASGNRRYVLYFAIDPESYTTGKAIAVDNTRIMGTFGSQERSIGMLRGSLQLTKAGKAPNGEIAGEFSVDVFSKLPKQ